MVEHQDDRESPSEQATRVIATSDDEKKQRIVLSEDTVSAQLILFLIAGYETSR